MQYWPDPGMTLTYGMCIVENISEDHPRQEYIKRNFRIALTSNVRHQYNNHCTNTCFQDNIIVRFYAVVQSEPIAEF